MIPSNDPSPPRAVADTVFVVAYHNEEVDEQGRHLGMLDGYAEGHRLVSTFADLVPYDGSDIAICEDLFRLLNVGDDPHFGEPDERAVDYRREGYRSLSKGDVVQVGDCFYACDALGWREIPEPADAERECEYVATCNGVATKTLGMGRLGPVRTCVACAALYKRLV